MLVRVGAVVLLLVSTDPPNCIFSPAELVMDELLRTWKVNPAVVEATIKLCDDAIKELAPVIVTVVGERSGTNGK